MACIVLGLALLAWLAVRVQREIPPTRDELDTFGRTLRPALVEVRDESARLRARLRRDR
jgi:hypothetical protein